MSICFTTCFVSFWLCCTLTVFQLNNAKHHLHNMSHNQRWEKPQNTSFRVLTGLSIEIIDGQWVHAESETPALQHYSSSLMNSKTKEPKQRHQAFRTHHFMLILACKPCFFDIKTKVFFSSVTTNQLQVRMLEQIMHLFCSQFMCCIIYSKYSILFSNLSFHYIVLLKMLIMSYNEWQCQLSRNSL